MTETKINMESVRAGIDTKVVKVEDGLKEFGRIVEELLFTPRYKLGDEQISNLIKKYQVLRKASVGLIIPEGIKAWDEDMAEVTRLMGLRYCPIVPVNTKLEAFF